MIKGLFKLAVVLLFVGTVSAFSQTTFEKVRDQLAEHNKIVAEDGSVRYTKQFERWKWFWEPRLMPNGDFPSAQHYLNEHRRVLAMKPSNDVQARPTWREVGPTAPDLPNRTDSWNGIGRVNALALNPMNTNDMVAGAAQGGLWRTSNGGSVWSPINIPNYPVFGVSDVAFAPTNPDIIFVATGDVNATSPGELSGFPGFSYGLLKSTDGGKTFGATGINIQPAQNNLVTRIWVDPRNANNVVVATYTGILKSTDGGETFSLVSPSLLFRDLIGNPVTYDVLYASTYSPSGGTAFYRSTNAGDSWVKTQEFPLGNRIRIAVTEAEPKRVGIVVSDYRSQGLEGVYRSDDYGLSFANLNVTVNLLGWARNGNDFNRGGQGFYDLAMEISPVDPDMWFVGGIQTWRSTNAGASWTLSASWTGSGAPWVHADQHFFKYHPNGSTMYATHDGGIARTTNDGQTWRDMSDGMRVAQYYDLAVSNVSPNYTIAGSQDNGTARSTNGQTFSHVLGGDGMRPAVDDFNASIVYASQQLGTFYRSANGGSSFQIMATPSNRGEPGAAWVSPIDVDHKVSGTVYIGYTNVHKSTNNGVSWTKISNLGVNAVLRHIAVAPSNSSFIYAAFDRDVFYTTNGGSSWQAIPGISGYIQDIEVHPDNPRLIYVAFGGFVAGSKLVAIDNGQITNLTGNGLPNVPANAVVYQKGPLNRLYLGTDEGVFFLDEGTTAWSRYGVGGPVTVVSGMKLIPSANKLRISTYGRGIWEVDAIQCVASKPQVTVAGVDNPACNGDTIVLTATDGYDAYTWSNGAEGKSVTLSNFAESGSYTVGVEDSDGCRSVSDPIEITIYRAPVRPNISLRGADTLRSTAIGGITRFQWYINGNLIEGATEREHVAKWGGLYTVVVTNDEGCTETSREFELVLTSVDNSEAQTQSISIRPNPVEERIVVELPYEASWKLDVVDISGRSVKNFELNGDASTSFDVTSLTPGMYILRISSGSAQYTTTFVKQ